MITNKRNGKMQRRSDVIPRRTELGYYIVFTDTRETEKNYLTGLKDSLSPEVRDRITVQVNRKQTCDLVQSAVDEANKDSQYREIWIVLDRDKVTDFDKIIDDAKRNNIRVGWSNPCLEIWFFAYFGSMPNFESSTQLLEKFEEKYRNVVKAKYDKSDQNIYGKLAKNGNEKEAIHIAEKRIKDHHNNNKYIPSEMCPCSTVVELVKEIKKHFVDIE